MRKNIFKISLLTAIFAWVGAILTPAHAYIDVSGEGTDKIANAITVGGGSGSGGTGDGDIIYNGTQFYGKEYISTVGDVTTNHGIYSLIDRGSLLADLGTPISSVSAKNLTVKNKGRFARVNLSTVDSVVFYNMKGSEWNAATAFNPFAYSASNLPGDNVELGIKNGDVYQMSWKNAIGADSSKHKVDATTEGEVYGTFKLGTNAKLYNMGSIYNIQGNSSISQEVQDYYAPQQQEPEVTAVTAVNDDVLSLGNGSEIYNGWVPSEEEGGDVVYPYARITEKEIHFTGATGTIYNAAEIGGATDDTKITFDGKGRIENKTTPYTKYPKEVPYIASTQMTMGNNSSIVNDFGGEIYASDQDLGISMGDNSTIINGQAPSITNVPAQSSETVNAAYMIVKGNIVMGDGAKIYNTTDSRGTSDPSILAIGVSTSPSDQRIRKIVLGASSEIVNTGANITSRILHKEHGRVKDGLDQTYHTYLTIGDGSTIDNNSFHYLLNEETKRKLATIQMERLLGRTSDVPGYDPEKYASNVTLNNTGYIKLEVLKLGNNTTINNNVIEDDDLTTDGRLRSDAAIWVGNSSTINNYGRILTDRLSMGDSSTLNVVSDAPVALVSAKAVQPDSSGDTSSYERQAVLKDEVDSTFFVNLSAGDDSEVNTNSILYAKGVLGSGSALTLSSEDVTAGEGEQITRTDHLFADPNWGHKLGAAFYGSLTQAEDDVPNTISVVSDSSDVGYSKLGGWTDENGQTYDVNVGTVNVKSGTLEMTGHITANVELSSDSVLRLADSTTDFQGSIVRAIGANNTVLHVKTPLFTTTGALDVDTVYLTDGGVFTLDTNDKVSVGEYLLGKNGTVKFRVIPTYTGAIEKFENATGTTVHIDMKNSSDVFLAPNKIDVSRLIVEKGIFQVSPGHDDIHLSASTDTIRLGDAMLEILGGSTLSVAQIRPYDNSLGKVVIDKSKLIVTDGMYVDQLSLSSGTFVYRKSNKQTQSVLNIRKDVTVGKGSIFDASGEVYIRNGNTNKLLDIQKGGQLSLRSVVTSAVPATMNLQANLMLRKGSLVLLNAGGVNSDVINVQNDGIISIEKGARLLVKNPIANQSYLVMSAEHANQWLQPENEIEKNLYSSFLYIDPIFDWRNEGGKGNLYFRMSGVNDLYTALWPVLKDENDIAMLGAMDKIHKSLEEDQYPAWLNDILESPTAQEAGEYVIKMNPDVHTNLVKSVHQLNRTMTSRISSVLHEIHMTAPAAKSIVPKNYYRSGTSGYYNYGRSGGDTYYRYRGRYYPYMPYGDPERAYSTYSDDGVARSDTGSIWVKPVVSKYDQDDIEGIPGYTLKNKGIMGGMDINFSELTLGIMGMYNTGDYDSNDSLFTADLDTYALGLYGAYHTDTSKYFVDFYATFMKTAQDTTQRVDMGTLTADYDTKTISGGLSIGYPILFARHFAFIPSIGADYARIDPDDFEEKSSTPEIGTKRVKNKTYQSLQSALAARLLATFKAGSVEISPEIYGKWSHEFKDSASSASVAFTDYPSYVFNIKGKDADKQLYTVGGSLTLTADESDRLFFTYAYDFNDTLTGHTFELGYLHAF